jgi:hypothetical protein
VLFEHQFVLVYAAELESRAEFAIIGQDGRGLGMDVHTFMKGSDNFKGILDRKDITCRNAYSWTFKLSANHLVAALSRPKKIRKN